METTSLSDPVNSTTVQFRSFMPDWITSVQRLSVSFCWRHNDGRERIGARSGCPQPPWARPVCSWTAISRVRQLPLQHLTPAAISKLYEDLLTNGRTGRNGTGWLSPKTVSNITGMLHKALADGVRRGTLSRNPADAIDFPMVRRTEPEAWDSDQVQTP